VAHSEDGRVRRVELGTGVGLAYDERGDPGLPPLLLVHAWVESRRSFDRLVPLLSSHFRVLSVDLRGHGRSDQPDSGYDLESLARDLEAFMAAVGLSTAVLVGSSSGGYVAQQLAVQAPSRVAGLVLVGSPRSLAGRPPFADEVDRLTDPIDPDWVRASLTWFPRYHDVPDWYLQDRVDEGVGMPARVWQRSLSGLTGSAAPTTAGVVTAPTLIIGGGRDELVPLAEQQLLAAAIAGSQLLVYDDAGHLVLWEQPERVAADVRDFVSGLPG
jgi:pimeloyl-ACP methyl ester carboxylesterase